jgi:hypothetical protein
VEKVGYADPVNYPILTKMNYDQWALLMNIKLETRRLWNAVDSGNARVPVGQNSVGCHLQRRAVREGDHARCQGYDNGGLESIKTMPLDCVRKASVSKLRREYELLVFRDGGGVRISPRCYSG